MSVTRERGCWDEKLDYLKEKTKLDLKYTRLSILSQHISLGSMMKRPRDLSISKLQSFIFRLSQIGRC